MNEPAGGNARVDVEAVEALREAVVAMGDDLQQVISWPAK